VPYGRLQHSYGAGPAGPSQGNGLFSIFVKFFSGYRPYDAAHPGRHEWMPAAAPGAGTACQMSRSRAAALACAICPSVLLNPRLAGPSEAQLLPSPVGKGVRPPMAVCPF